jgi:hypothetical protein
VRGATRRSVGVAALVVCFVAGVVIAGPGAAQQPTTTTATSTVPATSTTPATTTTPAPKSPCIYGGIRYVGTTSQKQAICFTLNVKRTVMREYAFSYTDSCGTGVARVLNPHSAGVLQVLRTGTFTRLTPDQSFKGVVKLKTASGTFRSHSDEPLPGQGQFQCDTGLVKWTAHRVG